MRLSRRLLFMLSLTLRGFNISIRVLCMSFFYLGSKSSGCIRRAPGNSATAAKRDFLLFQIGREDRNREDPYRKSATPVKEFIITSPYPDRRPSRHFLATTTLREQSLHS